MLECCECLKNVLQYTVFIHNVSTDLMIGCFKHLNIIVFQVNNHHCHDFFYLGILKKTQADTHSCIVNQILLVVLNHWICVYLFQNYVRIRRNIKGLS